MSDHSLDGRRMIVMGGSTGIGRGIADAWAAAGAEVIVCSRSEPTGPGAELLRWERFDLATESRARERISEISQEGLDAACFSAVYYGPKRVGFGDVTEGEWRRQLEVNLTGLWMTLSATLPVLRAAKPGLFIGVSSEVAFNAGPLRSGYAASKAAAKCLLDSVAQEEDGKELRIVQVLPAGMVDSPGIRSRRPEDFDYTSYMQPEAFAGLALHLALTAGLDYHGDSVVVDGEGQWWSAQERIPSSQSRLGSL